MTMSNFEAWRCGIIRIGAFDRPRLGGEKRNMNALARLEPEQRRVRRIARLEGAGPAGAHPEATEPASIAAPPELLASPFAAADGRVIYSSVTFDVVPPVLRDPHRLPGALQVADESATNAIEILISEAGAVERVTMVRPSTHLTDMMLLGAAKTWKFDPATRHGLAVKYRLRLDWAEAQR
jgi:TonB family protein